MRVHTAAAGLALVMMLAPGSAGAQESWVASVDVRAAHALPPWSALIGAGIGAGGGVYRSLGPYGLLGLRLDGVQLIDEAGTDSGRANLTVLAAGFAARWRPGADLRQLARGTGTYLELAGGGGALRLYDDWQALPAFQFALGHLVDDGKSMAIGPVVRYLQGMFFDKTADFRLISVGLEITFLDQRGRAPATEAH